VGQIARRRRASSKRRAWPSRRASSTSTRDDIALINMPGMDFKAAQGVTTVVCGNCGAGAAPANETLQQFYRRGIEGILGPVAEWSWASLPEFYDTVRAAKPTVNAAFLVPHGALRVTAMGPEQRPPTDVELARMKELLARKLLARLGCRPGWSTRQAFAQTGELIELAKVVAQYGGIRASHIRDEEPAC
jgi:N-acyl-D-amino-acid deacylase